MDHPVNMSVMSKNAQLRTTIDVLIEENTWIFNELCGIFGPHWNITPQFYLYYLTILLFFFSKTESVWK